MPLVDKARCVRTSVRRDYSACDSYTCSPGWHPRGTPLTPPAGVGKRPLYHPQFPQPYITYFPGLTNPETGYIETMLSSTLTRTAVRDFDHCEYFYDCTRPAEGLVEHPILGFLHACRTCAQTVGLPLEIGLSRRYVA